MSCLARRCSRSPPVQKLLLPNEEGCGKDQGACAAPVQAQGAVSRARPALALGGYRHTHPSPEACGSHCVSQRQAVAPHHKVQGIVPGLVLHACASLLHTPLRP
ncbi:MAG: hypothetical protein WDW38_000218 [Sanguina aurantia]